MTVNGIHTVWECPINSKIYYISDLVRDIKSQSSKFINQKRWVVGRFEWQEGFGAFSYAQSQLGDVINYIKNQERHHVQKTFKAEYIEILKRFNVDYDERYVFDPDADYETE